MIETTIANSHNTVGQDDQRPALVVDDVQFLKARSMQSVSVQCH